MFRVLFVCTANICRSPTAEGVFTEIVREAGLSSRIEADSAGVWDGFAGEPPDARARAAAKNRGLDLSSLRARRVQRDDYERFDLVLGMEEAHLVAMRAECPQPLQPKLRHFMEFVSDEGNLDMPDPYGGGPHGFELVLDLSRTGCLALLAEIRERVSEDQA